MKTKTFKNLEVKERKLLSKLRMQVSRTSNTTDLGQTFSQTMSQFFNDVLETSFTISTKDIQFQPGQKDRFILSQRLQASAPFMETWTHSNLPHFMSKAANATWHRYKHLSNHPEKTQLKIRQANTLNSRAH